MQLLLSRTWLVLTVLTAMVMSTLLVGASARAETWKAPGKFTAVRSGDDMRSITATWNAVADAHHYTVTVFDGSADVVTVVDTEQTSFTYDGAEDCQRYRVRVAAVAADGRRAETGVYRIDRLGPGGIRKVEMERTNNGETGTLRWQPPSFTGQVSLSGYAVKVWQMSNGTVVSERNTLDTTETIEGLNPNRQYVATVAPENAFGSCFSSKIVLPVNKPGEPTGLEAARDPGSPEVVTLSWQAPRWEGYGSVTGYQVGYRRPGWKNPKWIDVTDGTAQLELDPDTKWSFHVRSLAGQLRSKLSKELWFEKVGTMATPELDPSISVAESNGVVLVNMDRPISSTTKYDNLNVAIAPALGGEGFSDNHKVTNEAGQVTFSTIPCGLYTVTVTGQGPNHTKEFGRLVVDRCQGGSEIPADRWRLVYGRADIDGNFVDMNYGNEARVVSTMERETQDMVFSTKATLRSGWGYAIWTRASLKNAASVSGYSFQYDPGYENVNPSFGKALLLRVWQDGRECGNPIAKVKWPEGIEVNSEHQIMVVAKGDELFATIDGRQLFYVPSLTQAVASGGCGMAVPTGTDVGFRTWSGNGSAVFRETKLD